MDFLAHKVAFYRYPKYLLTCQKDTNPDQLEVVGYYPTKEKGLNAQKTHILDKLTERLWFIPFEGLDETLSRLTREVKDNQSYWLKIKEHFGFDTLESSDAILNLVLIYEKLLDFLHKSLNQRRGYRPVIAYLEFVINQMNLPSEEEIKLIKRFDDRDQYFLTELKEQDYLQSE